MNRVSAGQPAYRETRPLRAEERSKQAFREMEAWARRYLPDLPEVRVLQALSRLSLIHGRGHVTKQMVREYVERMEAA